MRDFFRGTEEVLLLAVLILLFAVTGFRLVVLLLGVLG